MRKPNAREKILAIAAAVAVFLQLLYMFVVGPSARKFRDADVDIQRLRTAIRKYYELERQRPELMDAYKRIERYLQLTGTENEKLTAVLTKIEAEAKNAGIVIVDLKPVLSQTKTSKLGASRRVHLSGEGLIENVGQFLYNLDHSDILFTVENFSLSLKDENKGVMKIDVDILGVAFS
jgi:hypothetical protein